MTTGDPTQTKTVSPVRELLANDDFRRFWIASVLYGATNGTLRFTFAWLVVETLGAPDGSEGRLLIALGIGAMLLSLPAGAWSDRTDRAQLYRTWTAVSVAVLAATTLAIQFELMTVGRATIAALAIGLTLTVNMPNLQAMVPLLVPRTHLMNAVAMQNGGGQAASFLGLVLAGVVIQLVGDAAGFGLLTISMLLALILMQRVQLPTEPAQPTSTSTSIRASVVEGARFAFGRDPLRTLLVLSLLLGGSFAVMQTTIPRVVKEVYGQEAGLAGLVLGAFGVGMLVSSAAVSGRKTMRHGVNVARHVGIGLGMGQFLLSWAPNVWTAVLVMLAWGLNAGVAMTSHRTLMQTNTPPDMMGRVMGLMMLGFAGALPIGALVASVLTPQIGPVLTMRTVGLVTMAITIPLTFRRSFLALR